MRTSLSWWVLRVAVAAVYLFALGPIIITATVSFNASNQSRFPPVGFSLRWWEAALVPRWLNPLLFSVELATGAAILAVLLWRHWPSGRSRCRRW
jgi:putative spermidine/putrescine transport system permease protein